MPARGCAPEHEMANIQTVWAEIDGLIFIVIVIASIIAQMIKAARKSAGQKTSTPENSLTGSSASDAESELRDFLRTLSGGESAEQTPSPPPPVPRPAAPAVKPAVTRRVQVTLGGPRREATASRPRPVAGASPPAARVQPAVATVTPSAPPAVVEQAVIKPAPRPIAPVVAAVPDAALERRAAEEVRKEIRAGAKDPTSLQKAWVLRDILGAPAAMRPLGYQG